MRDNKATPKQIKTYEMVYLCLNCNYKLYKNIPYGTEAPILMDEICSYCGCGDFSCAYRPDDPRAE